MDLLAHGIYGVTLRSRTGLAGGRHGAAVRWYRDHTVWLAFSFGLMPDVLSMWVPFAVHALAGPGGNFFHHFGGAWIVAYRLVHSILFASAVSGAVYVVRRALFVPSLAWPVHILLDAVSHGEGKFQTLVFYPVSDWAIDGINWWRVPGFYLACWAVVPVLWLGIFLWRLLSRRTELSKAASSGRGHSDT